MGPVFHFFFFFPWQDRSSPIRDGTLAPCSITTEPSGNSQSFFFFFNYFVIIGVFSSLLAGFHRDVSPQSSQSLKTQIRSHCFLAENSFPKVSHYTEWNLGWCPGGWPIWPSVIWPWLLLGPHLLPLTPPVIFSSHPGFLAVFQTKMFFVKKKKKRKCSSCSFDFQVVQK